VNSHAALLLATASNSLAPDKGGLAVRIAIEFDFYPTNTDGRTDYFNKIPVRDFLGLTTFVQPTYFPAAGKFGFKPPANAQIGVWNSVSKYIGKEISGKYYVTHIDFPEPGRWVELENPVGLFFDSSSQDEPFLTLYGFVPLSTEPRRERAKGKLENKGPIEVDRWVDWYPYYG
jgi:hypothetical protein